MTQEERLKEQETRLRDLAELLKRPPIDHTRPIKLPQHIIETMARTVLKCVHRELDEQKGDDKNAEGETHRATIEEPELSGSSIEASDA